VRPTSSPISIRLRFVSPHHLLGAGDALAGDELQREKAGVLEKLKR
jgi:hypothetical protein